MNYPSAKMNSNIKFNAYDQETDINRVSLVGKYEISNGLPVNPTQKNNEMKQGRGALPFWGPNHVAQIVFTKLKRDDYGFLALNERNQQILQILVVQSGKDSIELEMPEMLNNKLNADFVDQIVKNFFNRQLLESKQSLLDKFRNIVNNNKKMVTFNIFFKCIIHKFEPDRSVMNLRICLVLKNSYKLNGNFKLF
jgi:hypothetical protein